MTIFKKPFNTINFEMKSQNKLHNHKGWTPNILSIKTGKSLIKFSAYIFARLHWISCRMICFYRFSWEETLRGWAVLVEAAPTAEGTFVTVVSKGKGSNLHNGGSVLSMPLKKGW